MRGGIKERIMADKEPKPQIRFAIFVVTKQEYIGRPDQISKEYLCCRYAKSDKEAIKNTKWVTGFKDTDTEDNWDDGHVSQYLEAWPTKVQPKLQQVEPKPEVKTEPKPELKAEVKIEAKTEQPKKEEKVEEKWVAISITDYLKELGEKVWK